MVDPSLIWAEKLWILHPWECSRPGCMEPWVTWSRGRCPFLWQRGLKADDIYGPSQPKPFCDPMNLCMIQMTRDIEILRKILRLRKTWGILLIDTTYVTCELSGCECTLTETVKPKDSARMHYKGNAQMHTIA